MCIEAMQKHFKCFTLNAEEIARELGSVKCTNIVLFGAMTEALDLGDIDWEEVIKETVPLKFADLNIQAYRRGKEAAKQ